MASRSTRSRNTQVMQHPESQSRARWTLSLTKILLDLLVDQVHKGNKQKKSFTKKGWQCISDDFHNKTGLKWDMEQLKYRYVALRKQYGTVKSLLEHDDFRWDEPTGVIIATDEAWDRYIEEHPDCETIRSMGCPIYKQLCTIFEESWTNGKCNGSNDHKEGTPPLIPGGQHLTAFQEDSSLSESEAVTDTADEPENLQYTIASSSVCRKRGRKGVDDVIAKAILEMAAASKLRATAIRKHSERFSITDCVKALDAMQGVDEHLYYVALDLFNNRCAREIFLSLKVEKRLTWLSAHRSPTMQVIVMLSFSGGCRNRVGYTNCTCKIRNSSSGWIVMCLAPFLSRQNPLHLMQLIGTFSLVICRLKCMCTHICKTCNGLKDVW